MPVQCMLAMKMLKYIFLRKQFPEWNKQSAQNWNLSKTEWINVWTKKNEENVNLIELILNIITSFSRRLSRMCTIAIRSNSCYVMFGFSDYRRKLPFGLNFISLDRKLRTRFCFPALFAWLNSEPHDAIISASQEKWTKWKQRTDENACRIKEFTPSYLQLKPFVI